MTLNEVKAQHPDQSAEIIGACPDCKKEIAISPNAKDRGMSKGVCQGLFVKPCKPCLEKRRARDPHWSSKIFY